jgi:O-methyltransferase involved in polyketide biosynthesis
MDMAGMQSTGMMERLTSHMQMMETVSGDSMLTMLAAHRQMGENMLDRMTDEMRDMNMQPDARWNATADSVRQDMMRMGGFSAAELQASMPEHRARMARLMDMHRTMMGSMQH